MTKIMGSLCITRKDIISNMKRSARAKFGTRYTHVQDTKFQFTFHLIGSLNDVSVNVKRYL